MSSTLSPSDCNSLGVKPFVNWAEYDRKRWYYKYDTAEPAEPDIWNPDTNNATAIQYWRCYEKGTPEWKKWKCLSEYNTGLRNGRKWTNDKYTTQLFNNHLIESLASQLDLHPLYQQKAKALFLSLDLQKLGRPAPLVAYCTCIAAVHNSERNTERVCHPCGSDEAMNREFKHVAEAEGFRKKDLISVYNKVTQSKEKYRR